MNEIIIEQVSAEFCILFWCIAIIAIVAGIKIFEIFIDNKQKICLLFAVMLILSGLFIFVIADPDTENSDKKVKELVWNKAVKENLVPNKDITHIGDQIGRKRYIVELNDNSSYYIPYETISSNKRKYIVRDIYKDRD